ncbi:FAD-binding protein [Sphingosinicella terrae]|uniref:FAD-binding protein n=1 Tax=Sphingosinicella terrae TaxID=2172047 RepID=UPI000E0CD630|nr:FAD-binding protein [Sphingosinicella terrae]
MAENAWDKEVDLLVVGSGAGAMTGAIAAAVHGHEALVIEKSDLYGGTSATSGGGVWIPASHHALAEGREDSPEDAFAYVRSLTDPEVPDAKVWAFVRGAPRMLQWMEAHSELRMRPLPYTDYHQEKPGAKLGYRSHECYPLHGRELGKDFEHLRPPHPLTTFLGRVSWTTIESVPLLTRPPGWTKVFMRVMAGYLFDIPQRLRSKRDRRLTLGNALIGRLKLSMDRLGVPLWLNTKLVELIGSDGQVSGVLAESDGRTIRIRARRGVLLAAGGFERNTDMRRQYLPDAAATTAWTGAQENNTGDAIRAGMAAGAAVMNMDSAWWSPSIKIPGEDRARMMAFERALPGCIIVNQIGRRYMNEALSYHVAGHKMLSENRPEAPTIPSWFIFDSQYRAAYPVGPMLPGMPDSTIPKEMRSILVKAGDWDDFARQAGLSAAALKETIERFNGFARSGDDKDFQRGGNAYDRYYGDPKVQPNPNLRALEKPPFYGLPIYPGDIGTNGGLVTDESGRVLNEQSEPIAGLYACGNCSASVMGHSYPGAGSTLGPAMTFGFLAAKHAVGAND